MTQTTQHDYHLDSTKKKTTPGLFKAIIYVITVLFFAFSSLIFILWIWMDREDPKVMASISEHAASYISDTYPGNDFIIGEPIYSMMHSVDEAYTIKVHSLSSHDTYFYLRYNIDGHMTDDSYHENVTGGRNIRARLQDEYSTRAETVLDELDNIYYFQASLMNIDPATELRFSQEELMVDGNYDVSDYGAKYGAIIVKMNVDPENINFNDAVAMLRKMDELLLQADLCYQTLDLELSTTQYTSGDSSFILYDVTAEVLHCTDSTELLWELWEQQEQHRKDLKEKWANAGT